MAEEIWEDVPEEEWKDVPEQNNPSLLDSFKALAAEGWGGLKQIGTDPSRAASNLTIGTAQGLVGQRQIPENIANYLKNNIDWSAMNPMKSSITPLNAQSPAEANPFLKQINSAQEFQKRYLDPYTQSLGETNPGDIFLRGIGSTVLYAPATMATGGLSTLPGMAARSGIMGLYGIGENQNPLPYMLLSPAFEAAGAGVAKTIPKVLDVAKNPTEKAMQLPGKIREFPTDVAAKLFKSDLTPKQLAANLRAVQGTSTPLGSVIGSEPLKQTFEKYTSQVPFAGGNIIQGGLKKELDKKASNLMANLKPQNLEGFEDIDQVTGELLTNIFQKESKIKSDLFKPVDNLAEREGFSVNLGGAEKAAKDRIKFFEESVLYKTNPLVKRFIDRAGGIKAKEEVPFLIDESGKPIPRTVEPSIVEAKSTANDFYDIANNLYKNPKTRYEAGQYLSIAKAISEDIRHSIERKASPELRQAYETANKNFKENFAPFKEKDVYAWSQNKKPETIIRQIIKPGKDTDKYQSIERVQKLLPEDQKNLLAYGYLQKAFDEEGNLNPNKLASLINKLGKRQIPQIFKDPEARQMVLDYRRFHKMNQDFLANPKTGFQAIKPIIASTELSSALTAGLLGHWTPAAAVLVNTLGSRMANKVLTSPEFRTKLINKMLEQSRKIKTPKPEENFSKMLGHILGQSLEKAALQSKEE